MRKVLAFKHKALNVSAVFAVKGAYCPASPSRTAEKSVGKPIIPQADV